MTKTVAIIPARYGSTRFPGKPLVEIGGKPMIVRVWEQAVKVLGAESVCVATDDKRILSVCAAVGAKAIMTAENHPSGTDRVWEAFVKWGVEADVIINIQGDEPFVHESQIQQLCQLFDSENVEIGTLVKPISADEADDMNRVKAVVSQTGKALYFSRSKVPFPRGENPAYLKHIGMYGYRPKTLEKLVDLPPSTLEQAESLEQLRWLENDFIIYTAQTQIETPSVDTPEDLEKLSVFL